MKKLLPIILLVFFISDGFSQTATEEIAVRFENRTNRGYFNTTQIGFLMGHRQFTETTGWWSRRPWPPGPWPPPQGSFTLTEMEVLPTVSMTHGYMFNEHWAVGIGVGFEMFRQNHFPVFLDARYTLWGNRISPFFGLKVGYAFSDFRKNHHEILYLDFEPIVVLDAYFRNYGGLMLNPEMGVKFPLSERADLLFTIAYRHQRVRSRITQNFDHSWGDRPNYGHNEWVHNVGLNRLSISLAIMFR